MKEVKWYCDVCDAKMTNQAEVYHAKVSSLDGNFKRELDVCKKCYDNLIGI